ncbi:MBL fold metallo-hydrolase [Massilia sp. W12]|uniref:MBL fold metallo-hydrolase n=1 Tax=Massilia sp. W12 TaxID=3126507 RepID=UPI0030D52DF7
MSALALPPAMRLFERGWLSANNLLLQDGAQNVLIDSGYLSHAPQTLALLAHALEGQSLDLIVNTHLHSDHCGGNAALQARYGAGTLIAASEADKVRQWDMDALSYRATGQQCAPFHFDDVLRPGEVRRWAGIDWQILAAPGHDAHALMLYAPQERVLVSGDALWQNGLGVLFPELAGEDGFGPARATLEQISRLDVRIVIPGHGAAFADVDEAIARAQQKLDALEVSAEKHAWHALRVLLKFLLLERQQIALDQLGQTLHGIPLFASVNQRVLQLDAQTLAQQVVAQLERAGAARVEHGVLWNV